MKNRLSVGVDIGGSHITAALIDLDQRQIIPGTRSRLHIDPFAEADVIIQNWTTAIKSAMGGHSVEQIGIAMPGPFDYTEGISLMQGQKKYDTLYGLNVKKLLARSLHAEILFKNDAACFLQGEAFAGAVKEFDHCIGLTLGTGLGSAICDKRQAENLDLWKLPFRESMAEDYLSTRWFIKAYFEQTGEQISGVKDLMNADKEEAIVKSLFNEFAINLESIFELIIDRHHPEAIVIGGNIANAFTRFQQAIIHIKLKHPALHITRASLGEDAALLGAASISLAKTVEKAN